MKHRSKQLTNELVCGKPCRTSKAESGEVPKAKIMDMDMVFSMLDQKQAATKEVTPAKIEGYAPTELPAASTTLATPQGVT